MTLSQKLANFFPFLTNGSTPLLHPATDPVTVDPEKQVRVTNSTLQHDSADMEVLMQTHDAEFMSEGLVVEKLRVTYNSRSLEVSTVSVLEPTHLTRPILEDWAHASVRSTQLSSIGRAVNRSSYVAGARAACWRTCQGRFPDLIELLPNGDKGHAQEAIVFRRKPLSVTINWTINLKDDGEAQSDLSVHTEIPHAWSQERTTSDSEAKDVREVFDLLVRERGVTEAIAAIVKLLFWDD